MDYINFSTLNNLEKNSLLARTARAPINMQAIFSDTTANYVFPQEPGHGQDVRISLRTARKNVDSVRIVFENGEYIDENLCAHTGFTLSVTNSTELFDYYSVTIPKLSGKICYAFEIICGGRVYYYNRRGLRPNVDTTHNFIVIAGFKTPGWAKGAVMYQVYVDRFRNGDTRNDVVDGEYSYLGISATSFSRWDQLPKNLDVCNFAGGDLQGVIDKMGYLEELGVEAIYFTPVFVSPSNHKYDIQDYDYIDPHIGVIVEDAKPGEANIYAKRTTSKANLEASNALMAKLIETAHKHGIKVILDGVFNHCGAYNKWMDHEQIYSGLPGYETGAYISRESPYHHYFRWHNSTAGWPGNESYDGWWGHKNHPKLNFEGSRPLYDYIIGIGRKWVEAPFGADGWRMDVAADLGYSPEFNHKFWKDFRKSLKAANPEAIILAEHYGDPSRWLQGDEWDTIMNYDAFMEPVTWFLTGMQKHSDEFRPDMLNNAHAFEETMRREMSKFTAGSLQCAMNQLSNHDHSRFLTRTNMTPGRLHTSGSEAAGVGTNRAIMLEAVVMQMTWPGAPTLYYGDEAGLVGWTDPDNRRTYPWGAEDKLLLNFHKDMIKIRREHDTFRLGSLIILHGEFGVICYARWDSSSVFVIVVNNNLDTKKLSVPVWQAEVPTDTEMHTLIEAANGDYSLAKLCHKVADGHLSFTAKPMSAAVLYYKRTC
ncbi:MAG: glycoside hydrolase family 13 protein [Defluviitaleaceae bacterium]|nr:glycoside hydrolase family 13 protein [Defluviitaleaceae bacterium]